MIIQVISNQECSWLWYLSESRISRYLFIEYMIRYPSVSLMYSSLSSVIIGILIAPVAPANDLMQDDSPQCLILMNM